MITAAQTGFIMPMTPWEGIDAAKDREQTVSAGDGAAMFKDVFNQVVTQVQTTQRDVEEKQYLLSTGQLDDMHTLPIAEAKAALSLDVMVGLRNKAMEAYSELMRISM